MIIYLLTPSAAQAAKQYWISCSFDHIGSYLPPFSVAQAAILYFLSCSIDLRYLRSSSPQLLNWSYICRPLSCNSILFKLLSWSYIYHPTQLLRLQYCTDQAAQLIICLSPPSAAQASILYWSSCSIDHISIIPLSCSDRNTVLIKLLNWSYYLHYSSPQLLRLQYYINISCLIDHISVAPSAAHAAILSCSSCSVDHISNTPLSCSGCNTVLIKLLNWSYVSSFFIPLSCSGFNAMLSTFSAANPKLTLSPHMSKGRNYLRSESQESWFLFCSVWSRDPEVSRAPCEYQKVLLMF